MKKIFLLFLLATILNSCSSTLFVKTKWTPKNIRSRLTENSYRFLKIDYIADFGPIVYYKLKYPFRPFSIGSKKLILKLGEYEGIVDQHVDYKKIYNYKKSNQPTFFSRLAFDAKNYETIQEKNIDIELIKSITKNYEKWGSEWDKNTQTYAESISMKEIRNIRSEIRRIYSKL